MLNPFAIAYLVLLVLSHALPSLTRVEQTRREQMWTVASYNVSPKGRARSWARLGWLLTRYPRLNFVGLQEAGWIGPKVIHAAARAQGWKRPKHWHRSSQAWYRDRAGFRMTGSHVYDLAQGYDHRIERAAAGPTMADRRRINVVEGEQYGRKIVKGSLHLVPSVQFAKADALSEAQVASIARWAAYWIAHGYAVQLVGDFNFDLSSANGRDNFEPLARLGLRAINADDGATHGSRTIDLIVVSDDIEEVESWVVAGHRRNDHRIPLSRCRWKHAARTEGGRR